MRSFVIVQEGIILVDLFSCVGNHLQLINKGSIKICDIKDADHVSQTELIREYRVR